MLAKSHPGIINNLNKSEESEKRSQKIRNLMSGDNYAWINKMTAIGRFLKKKSKNLKAVLGAG